MARRATKADNAAMALLIIVGLVIYGIYQLFNVIGFAIPILVLITAITGYFMYKAHVLKLRTEYLRNKYQDEEIVQRILNRSFWQGQTAEQLKDSIGTPVEVDDAVLKTKKKEVWKYDRTGVNRFNLRLTLENDVVIGWDKKG